MFIRQTPKIASGWNFFAASEAKKPCDFCSEMVASPLCGHHGHCDVTMRFFVPLSGRKDKQGRERVEGNGAEHRL